MSGPRSPLRIKICGLTRPQDACHALSMGADALGFVFHPGSPRYLGLDAYLAIAAELPAWAFTVAVFAAGDESEIPRIVIQGGFSAFQIHGAAPPEHPSLSGRQAWRAFDPASDDRTAAQAFLSASRNHHVLLDPRRPGRPGGTGARHDPTALVPWLTLPRTALAGGLTPENVAETVTRHRPAALDASSGLETSPGVKDPARVEAFVTRARAAHAAIFREGAP